MNLSGKQSFYHGEGGFNSFSHTALLPSPLFALQYSGAANTDIITHRNRKRIYDIIAGASYRFELLVHLKK